METKEIVKSIIEITKLNDPEAFREFTVNEQLSDDTAVYNYIADQLRNDKEGIIELLEYISYDSRIEKACRKLIKAIQAI